MTRETLFERTVRQARQNQPAMPGKTWHCSKNGHDSHIAASKNRPSRCWKCDSIVFFAKDATCQNQSIRPYNPPFSQTNVTLTADELELVILALGLLLQPAAATLQAKLAGLRRS